jgi:hypothetical protein
MHRGLSQSLLLSSNTLLGLLLHSSAFQLILILDHPLRHLGQVACPWWFDTSRIDKPLPFVGTSRPVLQGLDL